MAEPVLDEPLELIAYRERAGRFVDAKTITCFVRWYNAVHDAHDTPAVERIARDCIKQAVAKPAAPQPKATKPGKKS